MEKPPSKGRRVLPGHQKLPASGEAREALRVNGQFWTPDWVADAMVAYALQDGANTLFDPGVGAGAFLRAGRRLRGTKLRLQGREIDTAALDAARASGLNEGDLSEVELKDFALYPPKQKLPAIVANPPYVRHHRISEATKLELHSFSYGLVGHPIDGRAGLHVFFFLRCLDLLAPGGRLAFIVSADICEGVYARSLWKWFSTRFRLDGVVNFAAEASPFPGVDTNAVLFLIRQTHPGKEFFSVQVSTPGANSLADWITAGCPQTQMYSDLKISRRTIAEGFSTGLSRLPSSQAPTQYKLGDFVRVMRGIATGDNDFFFMTEKRAAELKLPSKYFVPAVGRMRDVQTEPFTPEDLTRLDVANRPTRLLALGAEPRDCLAETVQSYLKLGETQGIPGKTLIATRNPWWRMEKREPPPFFFAYLGRRKVRFIRNLTNAVPLTCLLCIYPYDSSPEQLRRLWQVLSDERTLDNLRLVGKSYGAGALKVEPRALQDLPLPDEVVQSAGLLIASPSRQIKLAI